MFSEEEGWITDPEPVYKAPHASEISDFIGNSVGIKLMLRSV